MPEGKYTVAIGNDIVARDMDLNTALVLAEALFKKYFAADEFDVTIRRVNEKIMRCEAV